MVTIFYDGLCPVCKTEIGLLRRTAQSHRVQFKDITAANFAPSAYGRNMADFVGSIHGLDSEGRVISGLEVFRVVYRELGLGWLVSWTNWPVFSPVAEAAYRWFCRVRPRFSKFGSCSVAS